MSESTFFVCSACLAAEKGCTLITCLTPSPRRRRRHRRKERKKARKNRASQNKAFGLVSLLECMTKQENNIGKLPFPRRILHGSLYIFTFFSRLCCLGTFKFPPSFQIFLQIRWSHVFGSDAQDTRVP